MKKIIVITILLLASQFSLAATSCAGKVTDILDWPEKCNGNIAFKTDTTGAKWICTLSDKSASMILAAAMGEKMVSSRVGLQTEGDCTSINQYTTPEYIGLYVNR
jgi:hypothetical protein